VQQYGTNVDDIYFQKAIHRVRFSTCVNPQFFVNFLRASADSATLKTYFTGVGIKHFTGRGLASFLFPMPPLAEQQRIVAKVDELMALCDRLEAARERRRDRLTVASLQRLNAPSDAPAFREHANFHLQHLARLTTRPDQIAALRQAILNLAVRGQLVPQDPSGEPVSELFKHIQKEKEQLAKQGQTKKPQSEGPVAATAKPFHLPRGWEWSRFEDVFTSVTDGDHLPPPKTDTGIAFLVIGNVRNRSIDFVGCRHVGESYYDALDDIRRPRKGDLLYTLVGSYGIPVIVRDDRAFCVQRHIGILRPSRHVHVGFLARVLESRFVLDQATACATGIAQKTVPLSGLRQMLVPLPPLAEQHGIVAKVE
jgi:type I restriction enzyme, S subunit